MAPKFDRREFVRRAAVATMTLPWLAHADALRALVATPAQKAFRGIFAILQTPFNLDDEVDWDDLEREVGFCLRCGSHGLVWPQLAAEFYLLTDEERMRGAEVIIRKAAGGKSAVVIGVQAPIKSTAVKLARHAESNGADAVIALPPYLGRASLETALEYFRALAQAVKIPVFIQNSGGAWGPTLPASTVIQLAKEFPALGYIKEEVEPVAHRADEYVRSGVMSGIFSGSAGKYLLNEMAHGAHGTMPACEFVDIEVQIYELAAANKLEEARALYQKLLPMITMEELYGMHFAKAVLVRRGVFKTAKMRGTRSTNLDTIDVEQMDVWWKQLAPHFKT